MAKLNILLILIVLASVYLQQESKFILANKLLQTNSRYEIDDIDTVKAVVDNNEEKQPTAEQDNSTTSVRTTNIDRLGDSDLPDSRTYIAIPTKIEKSNVALVYPAFQSAIFVPDNSTSDKNITQFKSGSLNLVLWTRAAIYQLNNYDLNNNGKGGKLDRLTPFLRPSDVHEEQEFFIGEGKKLSIEKYKEANNKQDLVFDLTVKPYWTRPQAATSFTFMNDLYSVVLRDNILQVCRIEQGVKLDICNTHLFHLPIEGNNKWFQFSAIAAEHDQAELLIIYSFDVIGRLVITQWRFVRTTNRVVSELRFKPNVKPIVLSLSSVVNDNNLVPFSADGNLDSKVSELFKRDYNRKERTNYVETISPLFGLTKTTRQANDNNTRVENQKVPLCVVNGYWLADSNDQKIPIYCRSNDMDIRKHLPNFVANRNIIIYAMEFYNFKQSSYYHFFYTIVEENSTSEYNYYTFHQLNKTMSMDKEFDKSDRVNITNYGITGGREIIYPPNDLVYFEYATCNAVIIFYDLYYSYSSPYRAIEVNQINSKTSYALTFYINAALVLGNKFYFFTYDNKLITMNGMFKGGKCDYGAEFEFTNINEERSQDFLMNNLYNVEKSTGPYLLGYREVSNMNILPSDDIAKEDLPNSRTSGSSIIVIVIGIIIGALILAGLLYIFCLRGSDNDFMAPPTPTLARKSRRGKTPPETPDSGLHAVTVRSATSSPSFSNPTAGQTPSPAQQQPQQQTQQQQQPQNAQARVEQQTKKQATKSVSPSGNVKKTKSAGNVSAQKSKSPGVRPVASKGSNAQNKTKSKSPANSSVSSTKSGRQHSPASSAGSKGPKNSQKSSKSKSSNHSSKSKSKSPAPKQIQTRVIDKKEASPARSPIKK